MSPIFSDMVCSDDGGVTSWEVIYDRLEDERLVVIVTKATTNSTQRSSAQFRDTPCSFLHRIRARAKILRDTYMVIWVVENVNIEDSQFKNSNMELMGSLKLNI